MTNSHPAITPPRDAPPAPRAGVILFAHGARDERWAEPFLKVAERVRAGTPGLPVEMAYLEFMVPDLPTAVDRLLQRGVGAIRVIPLFFGRGGHLRTEVPRLIDEIAGGRSGVRIELAPAAGDDDNVIDALAAYCVAQAGR